MTKENLELILGLEIHLQLKTQTKMFSYANGLAGQEENNPNTYVDPVSLGLPGALPVPNKEAIKLAQRLSYALTGKLNDHIMFTRKNYFYPDLAKGYQITCPADPISTGGSLDLSFWKPGFKINFREIHLEEDTGKSSHQSDGTYLDYNKAGLPLLEIVTEPEFRDVETAVEFCKEIQRIARTLEVSDADLEKGHMRLEANISVREKGQTELPNYRVELKNINSFNFMKKAVNYEINRHADLILAGKQSELVQETRGFNESQNRTFVQRSKEDAHDYRYFPDPDIPKIHFDESWLSEIIIDVENYILPFEVRESLLSNGLSMQFVNVLVDDKTLYEKYKNLVANGFAHKKAADLVINIAEYKDLTAEEIMLKEKSKQADKITDEQQIKAMLDTVFAENPDEYQRYSNGDLKLKQFFIGQLMKKSQGKVDVGIAGKLF